MNRLLSLTLGLLAWLLTPAAGVAQPGELSEPDKARLADCLTAFEKQAARARNLSCEFTFVEGGDKIGIGYEERFDVQAGILDRQYYSVRRLTHVVRKRGAPPQPKSNTKVSGWNEQYAFAALGKTDTNSYRLEAYAGSDQDDTHALRNQAFGGVAPALAGFHLGSLPVHAILPLPDCRVQSVRTTRTPAGDEVVRFEFAWQAATRLPLRFHQTFDKPIRGWFEVMPKFGYAVTGYQYRDDRSKGTYTGTNTFTLGADGLPLTATHEESADFGHGPNYGDSANNFRYRFGEVDDKVFWLSAYGLPEPFGGTPPRPGPAVPVGLLVAAGLMAGLAVLFASLRRRSLRPAPAAGHPVLGGPTP